MNAAMPAQRLDDPDIGAVLQPVGRVARYQARKTSSKRGDSMA
jgi:hypothetical protein